MFEFPAGQKPVFSCAAPAVLIRKLERFQRQCGQAVFLFYLLDLPEDRLDVCLQGAKFLLGHIRSPLFALDHTVQRKAGTEETCLS